MSFRRRMVLLAAAAVAVAVVIASAVVYVVTRDELRGQVDANLRAKITPGRSQAVKLQLAGGGFRNAQPTARLGPTAHANGEVEGSPGKPGQQQSLLEGPASFAVSGRDANGGSVKLREGGTGFETSGSAGELGEPPMPTPGLPPPADAAIVTKLSVPASTLGGATGYVQLYQPGTKVLRSSESGPSLPIGAATREVAAGKRPAFYSDATVAGIHVRTLTERAPFGGVWQAALPLTDMDSTLSQLRLVLAIVCLAGVGLAAALGLLVSRAALVPVRRLMRATERIARTHDLGHRIQPHAADELGQLAESFNEMLAALERSRLAQRQLVSDASHELRTPLTSIRANLDALASGASLSERERERAVAAARAQLQELTVLVGDLVDLSKTVVDELEVEDVRLDLAVDAAVERARLHAPGCSFHVTSRPCLVRAAPARLDRALANMLDNACKWSPTESPVEVYVSDGRVQVRDHGPGISEEDLPRVFDRFYRAVAARGMPGSGLGLAIVRQVAETHRGAVHAENDPDGGARLTLELPALAMTSADAAMPEYAFG